MNGRTLVALFFMGLMYPLAVAGQEPLGGGMMKARVEADYAPLPLPDLVAGKWEDGGVKPFRTTAVCTGLFRVMPEERKKALADWANAFAGNPDQYILGYGKEMEVMDGATRYWLGIREKDLTVHAPILVASTPLEIFLIGVGGGSEPMAIPSASPSASPAGGESPKPREFLLLVESLKKSTR